MKKLRSISAALAVSERHDHRGPERLPENNTTQITATTAPLQPRCCRTMVKGRPAAAGAEHHGAFQVLDDWRAGQSEEVQVTDVALSR